MRVIVIVARGWHLGYLGAYGNPWLPTPHLDQLAADGIVFDQHFADVPSPEGARRSWRSGCYHWMMEPARDLFEQCLATQVSTRMLTAFPQLPVDEQFLWIESRQLLPPWQIAAEHFDAEAGSEPWLDPPIGLLDPTDDEAFLRLQHTYAAAVAGFDQALGQFLQQVDDDTLLLVTSDHGLPLGEHGAVGLCQPWLHDELVHIPLIVRLPDKEQAGRRIAAFTQAVDLLPTILATLHQPIPNELHGRNLLPLMRGEQQSIRNCACSGLEWAGASEWALRTTDWCLLVPGTGSLRRRQLYVKPDDRWEVNDVVQHHPDLADGLEQRLRAFIADPSADPKPPS